MRRYCYGFHCPENFEERTFIFNLPGFHRLILIKLEFSRQQQQQHDKIRQMEEASRAGKH